MLSFLIEKEFKQLSRNKMIPRMLVALPLMALLVFPWAANQEIRNVRVDVVDNDHSPLSQRLVAEIGGSAYFNISGTSASYPDALGKVDSDGADMVLVIPPDFEKNLVNGRPSQIQIASNAVNGTKGTLGASYKMSMVSGSAALREYSEKVKVTSAGKDIPSFSVSPLYKFNPSLDYKVFMVPALMVMLLTIICGFFPALNIVGEKESGTIEQINVTPVGKFQFILAKLIPLWIIGVVIMAVSLGLAKIVYGITPAGSLWTLMLFSGIYILVVSGMGLVVSNYASTIQQAMFVSFFFIMVFFLMGGLFTPVGSMPDWAQAITIANPLKYFIEVMRLVYLKGSKFVDMIPQFLALCGFAVAFGGWAIISYKKSS